MLSISETYSKLVQKKKKFFVLSVDLTFMTVFLLNKEMNNNITLMCQVNSPELSSNSNVMQVDGSSSFQSLTPYWPHTLRNFIKLIVILT